MSYFVGVDYGSKRTGLAVGLGGGRFIMPLDTIETRGIPEWDAQAVLDHCRDYEVEAFVVGLPLNMDGTEGPQAKFTRAFGDRLSAASGTPVHYWDERLSSFAAEDTLRDEDLTRRLRRAKIDRLAAQIILEGFLSQ